MAGMPVRMRQTQAERTERTRRALLEATVEAIAELGYAGASTTEIARRAGVSRGAQLHHFPTKLHLVSAALDHVFADREADFRRRFEALAPEERTQAAAVAVLWEISRGREQLAMVELLTAARTDPELRPLARSVLQRFEAAVSAIFAEVLPDVAGDPFLSSRVLLALTVLQGAALHEHLGLTDEAADLVGTLALLAGVFPVGGPPLVPTPAVATASHPNHPTPTEGVR